MNLQNKIDEIDDMISNLKQEITKILDIQQNPDITILNDSPRCFTIPISKLSPTSVLSPEYYDFELQSKLINAMIDSSNRNQIIQRLQSIIKTGFLPNIVIKSGDDILKGSNEHIKINPTVIDCIKRVIKDD